MNDIYASMQFCAAFVDAENVRIEVYFSSRSYTYLSVRLFHLVWPFRFSTNQNNNEYTNGGHNNNSYHINYCYTFHEFVRFETREPEKNRKKRKEERNENSNLYIRSPSSVSVSMDVKQKKTVAGSGISSSQPSEKCARGSSVSNI